MSRAKKAAGAAFASALVFSVTASPALAFRYTSIPASECAGANAGSQPNDNGQAKENLRFQERGGEAVGLPRPPAGTPGAGQGQSDEHCLNGR